MSTLLSDCSIDDSVIVFVPWDNIAFSHLTNVLDVGYVNLLCEVNNQVS